MKMLVTILLILTAPERGDYEVPGMILVKSYHAFHSNGYILKLVRLIYFRTAFIITTIFSVRL